MNYPTPLNFNETSTYLSNGFEVCNENEFKRYIFMIAYKPAVLSSPFRTGYLFELSSFLIVCACSPCPLSLPLGAGGRARGLLRPLLLAPKRGQFIHRRQNTFRLTRQRARREGGKGAARALISSSHNHGTPLDYHESRELLHPPRWRNWIRRRLPC